ncbi:MAG: nuclear transport factor 2 family protein [Mycobacterium sp.]|uniref:nuclear transport factor 2 family protein n=1 Tax=Mycobacterium sp. TaxID=1785 RepID=UPI003F99A274
MNPPNQELADLLARDKIRGCLARLARGEDRRNAELITASYWPRAVVDHGIFTGTLVDYLAWVVPGSPDIPVTQHVLGQSVIDLYSDTALVETHVLAYHRVSGEEGHRDTVIGGRYLDWMNKIDNEWRISRRTMVYDWVQDLGVSVDWAEGLMGMPFDATRHAGRAAGDFSERFFDGRWSPATEDTTE